LTGVQEAFRQDLDACLASLGVAPGDTILLHSDAMVVAQYPGLGNSAGIEFLLDCLEEALGPDGTLVLPTFTYSSTRGEPFDPASTPSAVGMVTELFRRRPGTIRTSDPIFSVAAHGPKAARYGQIATDECFGTQSIWGQLYREDALIVGLGCSLDRATFVHFVERLWGVDYRFDKLFVGPQVAPDGTSRPVTMRYYVRDLDRRTEANLARLGRRLLSEGAMRTGAVGRVAAWSVRASRFLITAHALLRECPNALIDEGAGGRP
jgi:aminoglycoside 3-N-acetyltransferase